MRMPRILLVEQDRNPVEDWRSQLETRFRIDVEQTSQAALRRLEERSLYAVVVAGSLGSERKGVDFFCRARELSPETVRVMQTSGLDPETAVHAVNVGEVFRFIPADCSQHQLVSTLLECVERHRVLAADREILAQTLSGAVTLLSEVLSLANPLVFRRASRIMRIALECAGRLGLTHPWELKLAAMYSQLGCIALPRAIMEKVCHGESLSTAETRAFHQHPAAGQRMLESIPGLKFVARVIGRQLEDFEGSGEAGDEAEERIALCAGILRVASDFDYMTSGGSVPQLVAERLMRRKRCYHPQVMEAMTASVIPAPVTMTMFDVPVRTSPRVVGASPGGTRVASE